MTAIRRKWRWADTLRRRVPWLAPVALLALAPKCLLCVLAYAGVATALIRGGPELCGTTGGATGFGVARLAAAAVAVGVTVVWARRRSRAAAGGDPKSQGPGSK